MYIRFQLRQLLAVFDSAVADAIREAALGFCDVRFCGADWQCFLSCGSQQGQAQRMHGVIGNTRHVQRSPALCLGNVRSIAADAPVGRGRTPSADRRGHRGADVNAETKQECESTHREGLQLRLHALLCSLHNSVALVAAAPDRRVRHPDARADRGHYAAANRSIDRWLPQICNKYSTQPRLTGLALRTSFAGLPASERCHSSEPGKETTLSAMA